MITRNIKAAHRIMPMTHPTIMPTDESLPLLDPFALVGRVTPNVLLSLLTILSSVTELDIRDVALVGIKDALSIGVTDEVMPDKPVLLLLLIMGVVKIDVTKLLVFEIAVVVLSISVRFVTMVVDIINSIQLLGSNALVLVSTAVIIVLLTTKVDKCIATSQLVLHMHIKL